MYAVSATCEEEPWRTLSTGPPDLAPPPERGPGPHCVRAAAGTLLGDAAALGRSRCLPEVARGAACVASRRVWGHMIAADEIV